MYSFLDFNILNILLYVVILTLSLSLERDSASTTGARGPGGGHLYIETGMCMGPLSTKQHVK